MMSCAPARHRAVVVRGLDRSDSAIDSSVGAASRSRRAKATVRRWIDSSRAGRGGDARAPGATTDRGELRTVGHRERDVVADDRDVDHGLQEGRLRTRSGCTSVSIATPASRAMSRMPVAAHPFSVNNRVAEARPARLASARLAGRATAMCTTAAPRSCEPVFGCARLSPYRATIEQNCIHYKSVLANRRARSMPPNLTPMSGRGCRAGILVVASALALLLVSCSSESTNTSSSTDRHRPGRPQPILFSPEGNNLNAFTTVAAVHDADGEHRQPQLQRRAQRSRRLGHQRPGVRLRTGRRRPTSSPVRTRTNPNLRRVGVSSCSPVPTSATCRSNASLDSCRPTNRPTTTPTPTAAACCPTDASWSPTSGTTPAATPNGQLDDVLPAVRSRSVSQRRDAARSARSTRQLATGQAIAVTPDDKVYLNSPRPIRRSRGDAGRHLRVPGPLPHRARRRGWLRQDRQPRLTDGRLGHQGQGVGLGRQRSRVTVGSGARTERSLVRRRA